VSAAARESLRLPGLEADWGARLRGGLGRPLEIHAELDSAMDRAHALGEAGEAAGACVCTEHQRRGRGRQARDWQDRPGESLLLALLLRPAWSPAQGGLLSLAAGLAVAEAAAAQGLNLQLKWPNDVLAGERKVAGVLTEARLNAAGYRHLVLGIGINVHGAPRESLGEPGRPALALDGLAGRRLSRGALLADLLQAIETRLVALEPGQEAARAALLAAWRARWAQRGRRVRDEAGRVLRLVDLASDGALWVEGPAGRETIRAGTLELILDEGAQP